MGEKAIKGKAITKVLSCLVVFAILMSVFSVAALATDSSNSTASNVTDKANSSVESVALSNNITCLTCRDDLIQININKTETVVNESGNSDLPDASNASSPDLINESDGVPDPDLPVINDTDIDDTAKTVSSLGYCSYVWIKITDKYCKGYKVYVDGVYQFTEGESGTPDGYCCFKVTPGYHTFKLTLNGKSVSKGWNCQCGVVYNWMSMNDMIPHWCEDGGNDNPTDEYEVKFQGIVTSTTPSEYDCGFKDVYICEVKIEKIVFGDYFEKGDIVNIVYSQWRENAHACGTYDKVSVGDTVEVYGEMIPIYCVGTWITICGKSSYYLKKIDSGSLSIDVWTADASKNTKTEFEPGDNIYIWVKTNRPVTIDLIVDIYYDSGGHVQKYLRDDKRLSAANEYYNVWTAGEPGRRVLTLKAWDDYGNYAEDKWTFHVKGDQGDCSSVVNFKGTATADENKGIGYYGSYYCKVKVEELLSNPGNKLKAGNEYIVCYGDSPKNIKTGDKLEVYGEYFHTCGPLQYVGQIIAFDNDYYVKKREEKKTGSLSVTIYPSEVRSGAWWKLTSGPDTNWHSSGYTITNIPLDYYTIRFSDVTGWTKPSDKTVTITEGSNYESGWYTKEKENQSPTAHIVSIRPNPANQGETVSFSGYGTDPDGDLITAYNWRSSIDGQLRTSPSFSTSSLSVGAHTIYFKVKDSHNAWSDEILMSLDISSEIKFIGTLIEQNWFMGFLSYYFEVDEAPEGSVPVGDKIRVYVYTDGYPNQGTYDQLESGDRAEVYAEFEKWRGKEFDQWVDYKVWVADIRDNEKYYVEKIEEKREKILPVPYYDQDGAGWCGETSLSMILKYYGYSFHPEDIAFILGTDHEKSFWNIMNHLAIWNNLIQKVPELLNLETKEIIYNVEDIKNLLNSGYPIFLRMGGGSIKHAVVIVGYKETANHNDPILFLNDPSGHFSNTICKNKKDPEIAVPIKYSEIKEKGIEKSNPYLFVIKGNPDPPTGTIYLKDGSIRISKKDPNDSSEVKLCGLWLDKGLSWRYEDGTVTHNLKLKNPYKAEVHCWIANQGPKDRKYEVHYYIKKKSGEIVYYESRTAPKKPISVKAENTQKVDLCLLPLDKLSSGDYEFVIYLWDVTEDFTSIEDYIGPIPFTIEESAKHLEKIWIIGPAEIKAGETLQWQAYGSYSDGSQKELTSQVSWTIDHSDILQNMGNGKFKGLKGGEATLKITYEGKSASKKVTVIEKTNQPPNASFTYEKDGLTVHFKSTSDDSDGDIETYSWFFGDGGTSNQKNPIHTYSSEGTYTVVLLVRDDKGKPGSDSEDVTVTEKPKEKPEIKFIGTFEYSRSIWNGGAQQYFFSVDKVLIGKDVTCSQADIVIPVRGSNEKLDAISQILKTLKKGDKVLIYAELKSQVMICDLDFSSDKYFIRRYSAALEEGYRKQLINITLFNDKIQRECLNALWWKIQNLEQARQVIVNSGIWALQTIGDALFNKGIAQVCPVAAEGLSAIGLGTTASSLGDIIWKQLTRECSFGEISNTIDSTDTFTLKKDLDDLSWNQVEIDLAIRTHNDTRTLLANRRKLLIKSYKDECILDQELFNCINQSNYLTKIDDYRMIQSNLALLATVLNTDFVKTTALENYCFGSTLSYNIAQVAESDFQRHCLEDSFWNYAHYFGYFNTKNDVDRYKLSVPSACASNRYCKMAIKVAGSNNTILILKQANGKEIKRVKGDKSFYFMKSDATGDYILEVQSDKCAGPYEIAIDHYFGSDWALQIKPLP